GKNLQVRASTNSGRITSASSVTKGNSATDLSKAVADGRTTDSRDANGNSCEQKQRACRLGDCSDRSASCRRACTEVALPVEEVGPAEGVSRRAELCLPHFKVGGVDEPIEVKVPYYRFWIVFDDRGG